MWNSILSVIFVYLCSLRFIMMKKNVVLKKDVKQCLECYYFNATSIRDKLPVFNNHFLANDYDLISITETWLNESVFDAEILTNSDFNIFRRDRSTKVSEKSDGGGVLLAVSSKLSAKRRDDFASKMEILWVEITLSSRKSVFVGTVYIPYENHDSLLQLEASLVKASSCLKENDSILMFGDFNFRDIKWKLDLNNNVVLIEENLKLTSLESHFMEITESFSLSQYNRHATCNENVLDLVFGHNATATTSIAEKATSSTHDALDVVVNLSNIQSTVTVDRTAYNFKKADFDVIYQLLACISWSNLDNFSSVNDALCHVYDIIFAVMKDTIPTVKIDSKKFPYWYDKDLISLIRQKERVRNIFVKNGRNKSSDNYRQFCELRRQIKTKQKQRQLEYVTDIGKEMKKNSKRFWSYVKKLKTTSGMPQEMSYNKKCYSNYESIVTAFNDFFKSVFNRNIVEKPNCAWCNVPKFNINYVTTIEMQKMLESLNPYTSSGYDNLSAIFLIRCAKHLAYPLANIFNLSIARGEYPAILKYNNVMPIYKQKGDKNSIESYRGISIQPVIAKLFEKLVNDRLRPHLKNLISEHQHGFQPNKSTFTNLACYSDFVSKCLDKKMEVHSVYTDFQKAFDVVPHDLLLFKMERQFGISDNTLHWFRSYLTDRFQRVVLNGIAAQWVKVTSGVPQGSILGPVLFLMYVNDLPAECQNSKALLFADDAKIFRAISCKSDCLLLQHDLNRIFEWSIKWKIQLKMDKCFMIPFTNKTKHFVTYSYNLGTFVLETVNVIKDLGIYFTSNFTFRFHIDQIVSKSNRMLGFIHRTTKHFEDCSILITLYRSLVLSKLEYCCSIWSPSQVYLIEKLERVQQRVVKWLAFKSRLRYSDTEYPVLCARFGLTPLRRRRLQLDLRNLNKTLNGRTNCPYLLSQVNLNVPTRTLRHNDLFSISSRLCLRRNSYLPRVQNVANSVKNQIDVFDQNIVSFKHAVNKLNL